MTWLAGLVDSGNTSGPNMGSRLFQRSICSLFLQGHQVSASSRLRLGFIVFWMEVENPKEEMSVEAGDFYKCFHLYLHIKPCTTFPLFYVAESTAVFLPTREHVPMLDDHETTLFALYARHSVMHLIQWKPQPPVICVKSLSLSMKTLCAKCYLKTL